MAFALLTTTCGPTAWVASSAGSPWGRAATHLTPRILASAVQEENLVSNSSSLTNASLLAGLAASSAGIGTIAATAGGVCAGGACVAGGAAAAPAAVTAFAGLQSWIAGGLVAAGLVWSPLLGVAPGPPTSPALDGTMAVMVRESTAFDAVAGSNRPTVLEFYRPACPRCNRLAPSLVSLEERARSSGANWVMVNTDEPAARALVRKFHVSELPHFSYFDETGEFVGDDAGNVRPEDVSSMLDGLLALRGGAAAAYASRPPSEVGALMHSQPSASLLVDVRQPAEYRLDGHIQGSVCVPAYSWEHGYHLPRGEAFVDELADELSQHATAASGDALAVVLICADGRLAAGAAQLLEDSGAAADVSVLEGGLQAWEWDAEEQGDESMLPPLVIDEDGEGGLVGAWV